MCFPCFTSDCHTEPYYGNTIETNPLTSHNISQGTLVVGPALGSTGAPGSAPAQCFPNLRGAPRAQQRQILDATWFDMSIPQRCQNSDSKRDPEVCCDPVNLSPVLPHTNLLPYGSQYLPGSRVGSVRTSQKNILMSFSQAISPSAQYTAQYRSRSLLRT